MQDISIIGIIVAVVAVSYTHLDVYKRQVYNNTSVGTGYYSDDNNCSRTYIYSGFWTVLSGASGFRCVIRGDKCIGYLCISGSDTA